MNLLYYLAEANIYLGVFYLAYRLLLSKETYYQLTRAYLLFSCVAAFILPVLQVGALKPVEAAVTNTINYTVPAYTEPLITNYVNPAPVVVEHQLTIQDYLVYVYLLGAGILFFMLMAKLFALIRLMRNAQTIDELKYKVVYLPETGVAFSFFNYLFIGDNAPGANTIIRHELVHIRQKHSFDIIFLEVLKVINWFNPFVYLLQNSLKTVHEYIADEQTAALEADALAYATFLVNNAYGTDGPSFTHSFFNCNLLKKRIIMLNQERSGRAARLKYLVILPLFAGLLCVSTLAFSKSYGWVDLDPAAVVNVPSADKTTEGPKFPPPYWFNDGFKDFSDHLAKTIVYHPKANDKGGIVKIDFIITSDHKISNVKIAGSTNSSLNASAQNAFNSYKGTINHSPGAYKYTLYYYSTDYSIFKDIDQKENNLAGDFIVVEKSVSDAGTHKKLIVVDGKIYNPKPNETISADSMVDVPENTEWAIKKWGDEAKNGVKLFIGHSAVTKKTDAHIQFTDTVTKPDLQKLGLYIASNIKYPIEDRKQNVVGRVITDFTVDANHTLQYAKVVRSPSDAMSDEIIRVLKGCPGFDDSFKPGTQYRLPITFSLGYTDGNGEPIPGSQNATKVHDPNSGIYNPNNLNISLDKTGLELNEVVIRGYVKRSDAQMQVTDTTAKQDWEKFGQDLARNVKYTVADRDMHIQGKVIALFTVDADHHIQYVKVVRTPSDRMSSEVIRSLKINKYLDILKPGQQYVIPISFALGVNDSSTGLKVEPGVLPPGTVSDPAKNIYNPNNIAIYNNADARMLGDVVIRGYIKNS